MPQLQLHACSFSKTAFCNAGSVEEMPVAKPSHTCLPVRNKRQDLQIFIGIVFHSFAARYSIKYRLRCTDLQLNSFAQDPAVAPASAKLWQALPQVKIAHMPAIGVHMPAHGSQVCHQQIPAATSQPAGSQVELLSLRPSDVF